MSQSNQKAHFVLVTFPAQGHINPALQFSKRLLRAGASVTLTTSISGLSRIDKAHVPEGLDIFSFSDGFDNGFRPDGQGGGDARTYMLQFRERGSESLTELFQKSRAQGNEVTCLVYTLLLPWASEVAREFNVPSALLWIQPASVFDVYYYYFRGYGDVISECEKDPSWSLQLPNLPFTLKARDLPSFLLPSTPYPYTFALPTFREQIEEIEKEETPTILINTFEELEVDALKSVEKFKLIPVGPLLPSDKASDKALSEGSLDEKDPSNKALGGGLFKVTKEEDYMQWLDYQEKSSVIYVSFGSISVLSKDQMEQLAQALVLTQRPFLWVIREKESKENEGEDGDKENKYSELSCMDELKKQGMIVPWCSQVEVLSHPSVGCFVTHCGWNSTLESITTGVPMVGFPQWTDQTTNAKLVEDVWKIGVRVKVGEDGVLVKNDEIIRCLEMVMESEEIRENAKKWSDLSLQAAREGGSSDKNLKSFIEVTIVQRLA